MKKKLVTMLLATTMVASMFAADAAILKIT